MKSKKLYRSKTSKMFLGVLGGLGEYFNIDPTILRLGFVVLTVVSSFIPGIILYFLAAAIIPEKK